MDKLAEIWEAEHKHCGLKEPVYLNNPAMLLEVEPTNKALYKSIKRFYQKRQNRWTVKELYNLALLVGLQNKSHILVACMLGKSAYACRQMLYRMKKAGVLHCHIK